MQPKYYVFAVLTTAFMISAVNAQPEGRNCNQMGREIALRAAEEAGLGLDASARASLAAIAEQVCTEFRPAAMPMMRGEGRAEMQGEMQGRMQGEEQAGSRTAGRMSQNSSAEETEDDKSFFDLEKIPPEDRVKRPGLKRR